MLSPPAQPALTKDVSLVIKEHSNSGDRSKIGGTQPSGLGRNGAASDNGAERYQSEKVRVAIVGVGNCASAFVQGIHYYRDADPNARVPGLMHVDLGGYHVRDIEFTAAFDIDATKVGKDLGEAIWAGQNNTIKFAKGERGVPKKLGVPVHRGMTHDGLGKYLKEKITKAPGETADIVKILKDTHTDVVVSYLPVGSEQATKWYVEQVLEAGCALVNCIPVFIAREDYWDKRFKKARLPIVGDDIKSQVGATIVHRTLARLFADRGVEIERTSQLNVGGNMDFYNMLERERLESKKISKTNAVTSIMDHELPAGDIHVGPSDYVPWLTDRKWAHIRVEGQAFGDVPLNLELKLEVQRHVAEGLALYADVRPLAVGQPRHVVRRPDVDVAGRQLVVHDRCDRVRLGDLLGLQPLALEHVVEVHVAAYVELRGALDLHAAVGEQAGERAVDDRGSDLGLDVVADDRQPCLFEALVPVVLAGDEHGYAVDQGAARLEHLLDVPLGRLLGADGQVGDDHVGVRVLEDLHDVGGLAGGLGDLLLEVLAEAVVGHAAIHGHAEFLGNAPP